jgi:hypothetical protein
MAHAHRSLCIIVSCPRRQHADCPHDDKKIAPLGDRLLRQDVSLCHDLTTTGAPLRDDELVAYILAGLDEDYNLVFTAIVARTDPITPSELYSQLLSFEQHTFLQVHQT